MNQYIPLGDLLESSDSGVWGDEDLEAGISVLRSTNFNADGTLDLTKLTFRALDARDQSRKLLRAGDILLEKSGGGPKQPVGRVCLFLGDAVPHAFGNFIARLRPGKSVLSAYLFYYLWQFHSSGKTSHYQKQTTGIRNLEFKRYLTIPVPVRSIEEQQRIVDELSRAEGIVRLRRQAQQKAAALIPAIFVDMFGHIPQDQFQRAEDICHFITKGTTPKSQDLASKPSGNAVPFIKVLHIADDGTLQFDRQPSFISPSLHKGQFARSVVYPNDVLMNIVGPPLGRITKVPSTFGEWNINQALAIFRPRESVLPTFLFHALRSSMVLPEILKLPVGVRQLNISLAQCRNVRIPVPSLAQQQTFAEAARAMESIVSLQRAATLRAGAAFQALLAKSFGTGEAHAEVHNLERALA